MSEPLTAGDMIEELQKVPADTVLWADGYGPVTDLELLGDGELHLYFEPATRLDIAALDADFRSIDSMSFAEKMAVLGGMAEERYTVEGTPVADLPVEVQELLDDSAETVEVHSTGAESTLSASIQQQPVSEPHSSGHVHPAVLSVVGVLSFLALAWVVVMVGKR